MRASFAELLGEARAGGAAVAAFTCYNLETAVGVLEAAEQARAGVILLVSAQSFGAPAGRLLGAALVAVAERAQVPVCVQLDHVRELRPIEAALESGFGAVMADGSMLAFDENLELVRAAVAKAARAGGHVEAELGAIAGDEDVASAVTAGALTDPEQAAAFAGRSGAACLAVSIGNVHGVYRDPPALDWQRLAAIRERVEIPLALHGVSGLDDADVRRAIGLGVAKLNVNTELRERYVAATAERLEGVRRGARVLELNRAQADAVAEVVAGKLALSAATAPPTTYRSS